MGKFLRGLSESVFGRSPWRPERTKTMSVPGWAAVAALVAAFAGGFLVGDRFGGSPGEKSGLNMREPERAQIIGEEEMLKASDQGFVVAAYMIPAGDNKYRPDPDGMVKAKALARWLRDQGLKLARPYEVGGKGGTWTVVVYFTSPTEQEGIRQKLMQLPQVPDASFEWLRKNEQGWPKAKPIR